MASSNYDHVLAEPLPDEIRLLRDAKAGNAHAFVQLYDAYVERVYRHVYFRASDDVAAEAITSRVFIRAWQSLGRYPLYGYSFFSWLCRIARNQVTEYYNTHQRPPSPDDSFALVSSTSALDKKFQDIFDLQAMRDALQLLTEEQRQILILKFVAGLPTENIARMTGKREASVRALEVSALQVLARIEARKSTDRAEFHKLLESCLTNIMNGISTAEECLASHPEYAAQLKPLLRTLLFLNLARTVKPSPTFAAHNRASLIEYLRFHSRKVPHNEAVRRMAIAVSMVVAALLATGTAHAQSALPGDTFYGWKRTSEEIWRAASIDPVATDIILVNRRMNEWLATKDDPVRNASAMQGYLQIINRLESAPDPHAIERVVPVIESHIDVLEDAGLADSPMATVVANELESLPPVVDPTPSISLIPEPVATETPVATEPEVIIPTLAPPTDIPEPTEILPTDTPEPPTEEVGPTITPTPTLIIEGNASNSNALNDEEKVKPTKDKPDNQSIHNGGR